MKILVDGEHPVLARVDEMLRKLGHLVYRDAFQAASIDLVVFGAVPRIDPTRIEASWSEAGMRNVSHAWGVAHGFEKVPAIVLSTGDLYSDKRSDLQSLKKEAISEAWYCSVGKMWTERFALNAVTAYVESQFMLVNNPTILRIFDCYGPGVYGPLEDMLHGAKNGEISLVKPGAQTRCYLHIDDFLELLPWVLETPPGGVFNIGATEEITTMTAAQLVWQSVRGDALNVSFTEDKDFDWWKKPDITKAQMLFHWTPKMSIRKGIFQYVNLSQFPV